MPDNEPMSDPAEPAEEHDGTTESLTPAMFVEMAIVDGDDDSVAKEPEVASTVPLTREEMEFVLRMAREQMLAEFVREELKLKAAREELDRDLARAESKLKGDVTRRVLDVYAVVTVSMVVLVGLGVISARSAGVIITASGIGILLRYFFSKG